MGLNDLDKIIEAKQLIGGVKDSMIMIENSSVRETKNSVYFVMESALEQAASLLEEITKGKAAESEHEERQPKENQA